MLGAGAMAQHVDGGTTGACSWELTGSSSNYTLTISGTGAMADYNYDAPWYSYRTSIKTLVISEGVTSIGHSAFVDCDGLTGTLTIPTSVTSIGDYAFIGCSGLTGTLTIPNGVTSVGEGAFESCSGLTGPLTIPEGVTNIGDDAFSACSGLTSVTIPNSVTSIGNGAFADCTNLTAIDVSTDNTVYTSEDGVLFNNNKTTLIQYPGKKTGAYSIPNSVTSIGMVAFHNCSELASVTIPDGVTSIGEAAFEGTTWYDSQSDGEVVYAGKVLYTYKGAMPANTSIVVQEGTLGIAGSAFSGFSDLTKVIIPNSVTNIGNDAFWGCSGLTEVTIGNGVTSIGRSAFSNCSGLTEITIPDGVTSIGDYAFSYCSGLDTIKVNWDNPPTMNTNIFDYPLNTRTLLIPAGTTSLYESVAPWASFKQPFVEYGNIADAVVTIIDDTTYTSCALSPEIEVKYSETILTKNADYTVEYSNETEAGDVVTITLTGIGYNEGTKIKTFTIAKAAGVWQDSTVNATYTPTLTLDNITLGNYVWKNPATSIAVADSGHFFAAIYTTPDGNYDTVSGGIKVNVSKAAGTFGTPEALSTTYTPTLTLGSLSLPAGYAFVADATSLSVADSGSTFAATYINPNGNYTVASGTIKVNIARAAGTFGTPEALSTTYTPTLTLGSLSLPAGYAFVAGATSLSVADSGSTFAATYTNPNGNYTVASGSIKLNIAKATGDFGTPETLSTTYTPTLTLGSLLLPAGYAFVAGATPLSVANSGSTFAATYTNPNGNYTAAAGSIKVNIAKAAGTFVPLAAIDITHAEGLTLGNIELPDNYVWQNPYSTLIAGDNQQFAAIYTEPSGNYEPANGQITVNVAEGSVPPLPPPHNEGDLQDLTVSEGATLSPAFNANTTHYTLLLPCGDSSVSIIADVLPGGNVIYFANSEPVTMPLTVRKAGVTTVIVHSTAGSNTKSYTVDVVRPLPSSLIWQYWTNILAVNLNEKENGGYSFTDFQWQKNGTDIDGATGAYLHLTTPPLATDSFGVVLTLNGKAVTACPQQFVPIKKINSSLRAYPNPVVNGQLTIDNVQWNAGDKVDIYNVNGTKVFETSLSIVHYPLSINIGHLPAGVYVVRVSEASTVIVIK
ncbi:hypothetical protein FACS189456_4770 [Bacteroidia bacterium]|nr:hypothetical protein FACS189456_4770 [Bacteroidia bacterium]